MGLLLNEGERGLIIGRTGSGKTAGAITLIEKSRVWPKIILDTKGEPKFDRFLGGDNELAQNHRQFAGLLRQKKTPEYIVIRPDASELHEPGILDAYPARVYGKGEPCLLYLDEIYQLHTGGRAGRGLTGALTRGRSKGISTLMGAQRPSWISLFCLTESDKFYIYRLTHKQDRKKIAEVIPDFDKMRAADMYHFYHYHQGGEEIPKYYSPFEYKDVKMPDSVRLKSEGWL